MDASTLRSTSVNALRDIARRYCQDLAALPESALTACIGGVARTPADYSFEVAVINNRAAAFLQGIDPGAWPHETWVTAPEDKRSSEAIQKEVSDSLEAIASALEALPDERFSQLVPFFGSERYPHEIAGFAVMHTGYHMGQLNLHQSFLGDSEVNWKEN